VRLQMQRLDDRGRERARVLRQPAVLAIVALSYMGASAGAQKPSEQCSSSERGKQRTASRSLSSLHNFHFELELEKVRIRTEDHLASIAGVKLVSPETHFRHADFQLWTKDKGEMR
jgi:hypothetical protein